MYKKLSHKRQYIFIIELGKANDCHKWRKLINPQFNKMTIAFNLCLEMMQWLLKYINP